MEIPKTADQGVELFGMKTRGKLLATASGRAEADGGDSAERWEPRETDWGRVVAALHIQSGAILSLASIAWKASLVTWLWGGLLTWLGMLGLTAGTHRLWAHRSYEASAPLRAFLAACHTAAGQGSIYTWVLEHRMHHKYHGTDDDPFNYRRGFLFSHVTSRLLKPHPRFQEVAATIDMSDIEADSIVMFQHRYWAPLTLLLGVALPLWLPLLVWEDVPLPAIVITVMLRLAVLWHVAGLINTGEQIWSLSVKNKYSVDSNLVFFLNRTHWPQYHYLLPWDYRTGEFGSYDDDCVTTAIRVWAALGWAWGLRTVGRDAVRRALAASDDVVSALEEEGRRVAKQSLFLQ
ncbi:acyl-CoA Delta-9 desaturase-like [Schistocerca serialis cubense]|uniref:acyl-CoA Delta-9 desaturase-like n=1 Tax=Schistocerca serialis cubense TaxID=2023355 RepID=UPI00214E2FCC|nr:acyl-CoA Delta-9 desaturase-like [Schistocerca serialis cubense]